MADLYLIADEIQVSSADGVGMILPQHRSDGREQAGPQDTFVGGVASKNQVVDLFGELEKLESRPRPTASRLETTGDRIARLEAALAELKVEASNEHQIGAEVAAQVGPGLARFVRRP